MERAERVVTVTEFLLCARFNARRSSICVTLCCLQFSVHIILFYESYSPWLPDKKILSQEIKKWVNKWLQPIFNPSFHGKYKGTHHLIFWQLTIKERIKPSLVKTQNTMTKRPRTESNLESGEVIRLRLCTHAHMRMHTCVHTLTWASWL